MVTKVTICGVKRPCETCKGGIWDEDHEKITGCYFGHIKPQEFKKKKKKKQQLYKLRSLFIGFNFILMYIYVIIEIITNNPLLYVAAFMQGVILLFFTKYFK